MNSNLVKIPILILSSIGVGVFSAFLFISSKITDTTKNDNISTPEITNSSQAFIPKELTFCGQKVPVEYFDVYESLDNELTINMYRHASTIMYIKKANRFFPEIEKELKEHNIPDDFKYLCVAESGLSNVVSPSGATGFWQFMKPTGTEFNLYIDTNVDERYDHHKSVIAACAYLNKAYKTFNDWALVAASYNMGMGGLKKSLQTQKVCSYWDLHLNQETARYVYRIIALKLIIENPEKYGFNLSDDDLYKEIDTYTIKIDTTITDLTQFAFDNGANYKILKYFNPWLRGNTLPNASRKEYIIVLPNKGVRNCNIPK